MQFHHYSSIETYVKDVLPFLEQEEAGNNLMIGLLLHIRRKPQEMKTASLFSIKEKEQVVLVAMRTSPERALLVYGDMEKIEGAANKLCEELMKLHFKAHQVLGIDSYVIPFLKIWNHHFKLKEEAVFQLKVFRLDQLTSVRYSEGTFRIAQKKDLPLLAKWRQAFDVEAFSKSTSLEEARKGMEEKVENEDLYVWEDRGVVVTMAARARPTRHGITVNYVYTPPEYRKKGYATSCVAQLSQHMLDSGYEFCSLFTDADNPTSNKIYQSMGYEWIADFVNVKLKSMRN